MLFWLLCRDPSVSAADCCFLWSLSYQTDLSNMLPAWLRHLTTTSRLAPSTDAAVLVDGTRHFSLVDHCPLSLLPLPLLRIYFLAGLKRVDYHVSLLEVMSSLSLHSSLPPRYCLLTDHISSHLPLSTPLQPPTGTIGTQAPTGPPAAYASAHPAPSSSSRPACSACSCRTPCTRPAGPRSGSPRRRSRPW